MRPAVAAAALLALLAAGWAPGEASANGLVQREIQGRIESVDAAAGRLVVVRDVRGRPVRVELRARPDARIFGCGGEGVGLDRVKKGMVVSAFYEVAGPDGIANLIVIEGAR